MKTFLQTLRSLVNILASTTNVLVKGFPYHMRVILNPDALLKIYAQHQIKKYAADVNLKLGPLNRILGQYHLETGQIDVDVLEIAAARVRNGSPEELDREVTKVIAHEFRHACQREQHSKFGMKWDQFAISGLIMLAGWALVYFTSVSFAISAFQKGGFFFSLIGFVQVICAWIMARFIFRFGIITGYRWCWVERDARRYEEASAHDPLWADVITVHREELTPMEAQVAIEEMTRELFLRALGTKGQVSAA